MSPYIVHLRTARFVPSRVEVPHTAGEVGAGTVERLSVLAVLIDTIVDAVNGLDEFLDVVRELSEDHVTTGGPTLYILSHSVSTLESEGGSWTLSATISRPKCLNTVLVPVNYGREHTCL
jgi:hypothetical protein